MSGQAAIQIKPDKTHLSVEYTHARPLTACHWEPRSRFIFFGAEDNLVHRFELASKSVVSLAAHDSWVRGFGTSSDGEFLYTGGYDGRLVWWPAVAEKPEPIRVVAAHQGWIRAVAVSPDGKKIATCGNDRLVKLWNASDGSLVREFQGHQSHVYNVEFSLDSAALVSCDLKGVVMSWDIDTGSPRELVTVKALHEYDTTFRADIGGARSIGLRADGAQLALGGITNVTNAFAGVGDIVVALVNVATGKIDLLLESTDKTKGAIWGVAYHPAEFWMGLSGGGGGGWIYFWKGNVAHEFFKYKLANDGRGMSLSPDRTQVAVAHADMHLRIYAMHDQAN